MKSIRDVVAHSAPSEPVEKPAPAPQTPRAVIRVVNKHVSSVAGVEPSCEGLVSPEVLRKYPWAFYVVVE